DGGVVGQAGLARAVWLLFVSGNHLLHLGFRGGLSRLGKHAPLRSLYPRIHCSRRAPFSEKLAFRITLSASVCDRFCWTLVCGGDGTAGLLCLELHSR